MASREYKQFYSSLIAKAIPAGLSVEETRASFERLMADFPPPETVRFEPFSIGSLPATWVLPERGSRRRILLFLHGGSYSAGSTKSHKGLLGRLALASGCAILSVDYRLAPEHPFPEGLEDACTAYRWLLHHPYPPTHLAIGGISAGAGLALALALRIKLEQKSMPAAVICFSPWVDLAMKGSTIRTNNGKDLLKPERLAKAADMYAKDLKDPFVSPLYGDLGGLPPLFIQAGMSDLLYDEAQTFSEKAEKNGVPVEFDAWEEMIHAWQLFHPKFPESQEAVEKAAAFLKRVFPREE